MPKSIKGRLKISKAKRVAKVFIASCIKNN